MFLVALTGGIAVGKSTVSQILINEGIKVIDADVIAREVVEPGKSAWKKIQEEFDNEIFDSDGCIIREKLGQIIFNSEVERKKLNSIVHPEILKVIIWQILCAFLSWKQFVVLDVPLFFSSISPWKRSIINKVVVVTCSEETRKNRLMLRNSLSADEALSRIRVQLSLSEQENLADELIVNDGCHPLI